MSAAVCEIHHKCFFQGSLGFRSLTLDIFSTCAEQLGFFNFILVLEFLYSAGALARSPFFPSRSSRRRTAGSLWRRQPRRRLLCAFCCARLADCSRCRRSRPPRRRRRPRRCWFEFPSSLNFSPPRSLRPSSASPRRLEAGKRPDKRPSSAPPPCLRETADK